jgi:hypothetical protein
MMPNVFLRMPPPLLHADDPLSPAFAQFLLRLVVFRHPELAM